MFIGRTSNIKQERLALTRQFLYNTEKINNSMSFYGKRTLYSQHCLVTAPLYLTLVIAFWERSGTYSDTKIQNFWKHALMVYTYVKHINLYLCDFMFI